MFDNNPVIHNIKNTIYIVCIFLSNHSLALNGKNFLNIFEPSSGGIGNKLKTPSPILTDIAALIIKSTNSDTFV